MSQRRANPKLDLSNALSFADSTHEIVAELRLNIVRSLEAIGCDRLSKDSGDIDIADELVKALSHLRDVELFTRRARAVADALRAEHLWPYDAEKDARTDSPVVDAEAAE